MGLTSSHWGVYEFVVKNGRLSELNPFSQDPDPSPIGPSIIDLLEKEDVNPTLLEYINRLSDFLFVAARFENREVGDILWTPEKKG